MIQLAQPNHVLAASILKDTFEINSSFILGGYPFFWIRLFGVFITALIFSLLLGKISLSYLSRWQVKQVVREEGPKTHYSKSGTPTMGGVGLILALIVSLLLWGNWSDLSLWLSLAGLGLFALIGFLDDFIKIQFKNTSGLRAKYKYLMQSLFALVIILFGYKFQILPDRVFVPFISGENLNVYSISAMGVKGAITLFIWQYIVIVGASNAVNLTDGLDGLVSVPVICVAIGLAILAYFASNFSLSQMVHIPYFSHGLEVMVVLVGLVGACMGFLWFNTYPAQMFMGDVGALALGALLGVCALMLSQEIIFAVMGFLFVIEALSVMIQVVSYKIRGKRVFLMAPIHHHFELKGWEEPKICVRFWLLSVVFVALGLLVLL